MGKTGVAVLTRLKKSVFFILIGLWISGVTYVMSLMTPLHALSFFPDRQWAVKTSSSWSLTHVLGPGCKCSQRVYQYLLERGPQSSVEEVVVLLGEMKGEEKRLQERGFQVQPREARELASEKAVGVPFLLITSPAGDAVYAGGYSHQTLRADSPVRDLEILDSLRGGKTPQEFPIFGCAVSRRIQSLIDPLSLKYKKDPLL